MAAGKSTVAQLLAEQLPRAAHVRGDMFRRFIVTGRVDPTPSMPPEAMRQLLLRYQLAMSVADAYVRAGFTAVVQDVIVGPVLADVVGMSTTRPRHVVVLNPNPTPSPSEKRSGASAATARTGRLEPSSRDCATARHGWDSGSTPRARRPRTPYARSWHACPSRPSTRRRQATYRNRRGILCGTAMVVGGGVTGLGALLAVRAVRGGGHRHRLPRL
jgi:hypothetical protein